MKKLRDLIRGQQPIGEAMKQLKGEGINLEDLLAGRLSREVVRSYFDATGFGTSEVGGRILVIEPPTSIVDAQGRPVRLYYVIDAGATIDLGTGGKPFYDRGELEGLLPIDLTEIILDATGNPIIKRKPRRDLQPKDPNKPNLQNGTPRGARRKTQFDVLLYDYLLGSGDEVTHLIQQQDLDDDKQAIAGEEAIRNHFPEADALLALGVTKVHSIESWVKEMVEERLKRLRKDVIAFYSTLEGKDFVKRFLAEKFPLEYDTAPSVINWVLRNPIPGREAQFLLAAVGSGYLHKEKADKDIFQHWATIARDVKETIENRWVHEQGLLAEPKKVGQIYIPMLRAFRERRGLYSGRTFITTLRGLYGLGKILDTEGDPIRIQNLERTYAQPGSYVLANYPAIEAVVDEVLERRTEFEEIAKISKTTPGFVGNVLLARDDLHARLQARTTSAGKVEMVPIPERQLERIIPVYFRVELDRYRERMTFSLDRARHLERE